MRFILGMIVGALLLGGAAYVHDTMMARPRYAGEPAPKPFVNWDQFTIAFGR